MKTPRKIYKKLYWCYSLDEKHQAPIVASGLKQSREKFANKLGFDIDRVVGSRICRLPDQHQQLAAHHPNDSLLLDCGMEIVDVFGCDSKLAAVVKRMLKPGGRILKYKNRIFQESL